MPSMTTPRRQLRVTMQPLSNSEVLITVERTDSTAPCQHKMTQYSNVYIEAEGMVSNALRTMTNELELEHKRQKGQHT